MRTAAAVAIPLLCALLQVSVVRYLSIGEAGPDLLALVVVSWSLIGGAAQGVWWAFAGGIAADLLGSAAFGATTVSLLPVALGFGLRDRTAGEPTLIAGAVLVGAGALAHHLAQALVLVLVGASLPPLGILLAGGVGTGLYTGTLALAVYPLLRMLHRRTAREPAFDW
jgi:rod shape-determining protein MreD